MSFSLKCKVHNVELFFRTKFGGQKFNHKECLISSTGNVKKEILGSPRREKQFITLHNEGIVERNNDTYATDCCKIKTETYDFSTTWQ